MIVIVMGVEGSGKTTVGSLLAQRLGYTFLDADTFHSAENKRKIHAGIPLNDDDRLPWLRSMHDALTKEQQAGSSAVLACSALKDEYRSILTEGLTAQFVLLKGSYELIKSRLEARKDHFAGTAILRDQFATLQEPEDAIVVDVAPPPQEIVDAIVKALAGRLA